MPEGRRPSANAAIVSSEMPALRPRGTWTNHSKCCVHSLETASMTSSLIRGSSELWNRRYSPTFCSRSMSSGPRKGVKGPFVPLLRSPELMDRLQKVGEYLRFQSSLEQRISELIMLVVSREWTQHFEWFVHVPLGRKAGISEDTIAALSPYPL